MDILIRSAVINDILSPFHLKKRDVHIKDGKIISIKENIAPSSSRKLNVVEGGNLHLSPGWFDMKVNFGDPGFEHKEDIHSGIKAASAGGFTGVLLMPSTNPVIQSKSVVEYVLNKSKGHLVDVFPAGALTMGREGKEPAEMYDMKISGALAFSDDKRTIADAGLMQRLLLYGRQVDSLIISYSQDQGLAGRAFVNESLNTTRQGLKGIPDIAEEVIISRDISLVRYTKGRLHFSLVSTAAGVELIRKAKKEGLNVSADVSAYHLVLDDSYLENFDTNLKTQPPLRSYQDKESLLDGLLDGTIDAIVSDHSPQEDESKKVEFDFASFGMIGLETAYACAQTALRNKMAPDKIVSKFTAARNLLGLPLAKVEENQTACLTLFDPDEEWVFKETDIYSKSKNSPFIGTRFHGRVRGIVNNGNCLLREF